MTLSDEIIIDETIDFFKSSIKEKIIELKPYIESLTAAGAQDDFELINDLTYILVNLMLEIHSRMKALNMLEKFKENYECE